MEHIAQELRAIDDFCEENKDMSYDELLETVEHRVKLLSAYANEKGLPLMVNADDIIAKHRNVDYDNYEDDSEEYEEESSSYEETSEYDEDDNEEQDEDNSDG